jgi:hypothetical protein
LSKGGPGRQEERSLEQASAGLVVEVGVWRLASDGQAQVQETIRSF